MKLSIKILLLILLYFQCSVKYTQITHGTILYERKTNLLKKYKDPNQQRWLRGEKVKIDRFNLYFSPEKSLYLPDENVIPSKADWATSKNTVIQDFKKQERTSIYNLFGEKVQHEIFRSTNNLEKELDFRNLNSGLYHIELKTPTEKVIKTISIL